MKVQLLNKVVSRNGRFRFSFFVLCIRTGVYYPRQLSRLAPAGKKPSMETDLALFTLFPRMKTAALDVLLTIVINRVVSPHQQPVNRPVFTLIIIVHRSRTTEGSTFLAPLQNVARIPWNSIFPFSRSHLSCIQFLKRREVDGLNTTPDPRIKRIESLVTTSLRG